jgi:hypothetical protein
MRKGLLKRFGQHFRSASLLITATAAAVTIGSLSVQADCHVFDFPTFIVVSDFNNDGQSDIAVVETDYISLLLSNGDGTFQPALRFFRGGGPGVDRAAVGDFNGDGAIDLAVTSQGTNQVGVLLGNGDGSFQTVRTFHTGLPDAGFGPGPVAVGDFNNDGIPDLAIVNDADDIGSVLLGNGDGTFQGPGLAFLAYGAVAVADFNGDGLQDVAAIYDRPSISLGYGDGTFRPPRFFTAHDVPFSLAPGDINGDGRQDIVVANVVSSDVSVLLGNGDGTVQSAINYGTGTAPWQVLLNDFNSDGLLDVATANRGSNDVSVLLGNGDGTFQAAQNFAAGDVPGSLAVGDFNGDGIPDLAVLAFVGSNVVSVLLGVGDGTFQAPLCIQ